jgi:hypothetical protein
MAKVKYRNHNGDACYVFAWVDGGGNHVFALALKHSELPSVIVTE